MRTGNYVLPAFLGLAFEQASVLLRVLVDPRQFGDRSLLPIWERGEELGGKEFRQKHKLRTLSLVEQPPRVLGELVDVSYGPNRKLARSNVHVTRHAHSPFSCPTTLLKM
jgi:hypothetical protein